MASASFTLSVTGTYTWTAYDESGATLGTATSSANEITINDIGAIAKIEIAPTDAASDLTVNFSGTSVRQIENATDEYWILRSYENRIGDVLDAVVLRTDHRRTHGALRADRRGRRDEREQRCDGDGLRR